MAKQGLPRLKAFTTFSTKPVLSSEFSKLASFSGVLSKTITIRSPISQKLSSFFQIHLLQIFPSFSLTVDQMGPHVTSQRSPTREAPIAQLAEVFELSISLHQQKLGFNNEEAVEIQNPAKANCNNAKAKAQR
ncbi:hypothetical protein IC575_029853 [Cucumis melo]